MKSCDKMNKVKAAGKLSDLGYRDPGNTSCPAGAFETSALPDVHAAVIKNRSWISSSPGLKTWDSDHAAAPEHESVAVVLIID